MGFDDGCDTPTGAKMDLDELVEHFRGPLTGLIASWGVPPADAIELCMDTFAEGYLVREKFRGDWGELASTGAWLRGIAYNLFRAYRRRVSAPMEALGERDLPGPSDPGEGTETSRADQVRWAMDALKGDYRTVLYMRYVENSGLAEIAGLLEVSERAVEGRLYRARKALAEQLGGLVSESKTMAGES
ncbi:MAG: sigma-70 family RNA polymerase sigma factor, partial [Planctomycetota bacterium]|nr:sigma-70 family RNA polymerase sigma factor [Planctomycetota bacterium]